jgi:hypothetical protein
MTLQEFYSNPDNWVQGVLFQSVGDKVRKCMLGALSDCYTSKESYTAALGRLRAACNRENNINPIDARMGWSVSAFNDHPKTTIEDIRRVVKAASV